MNKIEKEVLLEAITCLEESGWWLEKNKKFGNKVPVEILKELYNKLSR